TGSRPWAGLGRLADLVEAAVDLGTRIPALEPLFLNLRQTSAADLEGRGSYFGWVLEVVQHRTASAAELRAVMGRAIRHLEEMPASERARWMEFLSYFFALVYHEREKSEHQSLQEIIEASVQTDAQRKEVTVLGQTIAEALLEEGEKKGRRK